MKIDLKVTNYPKGHLVFAVLAGLILTTVSGNLFLTHKIMDVFKESVSIHETWSDQISDLNSLVTYADRTVSVGHELFQTNDVANARLLRDERSATFNRELEAIREAFSRTTSIDLQSSLDGHLDRIKYSMEQVVRDFEAVFQIFGAGETALASRLMIARNDHQQAVIDNISQTVGAVEEIMHGVIESQIANADLFQEYAYIIVAVLILFLTYLWVYGRSIYMNMLRNQEAHARAVGETGEALAELAGHKLALEEHAIVDVLDTSGHISYVNDRFCEVSKYSRDELVGGTYDKLHSDYHPDSFYVEINQTISNGETWQGEINSRAKDGSSFWVDTTIAPVRDADGKIREFISVRTDITELKNAAQNRQKDLDLLNTTFANFPGAISVLDADLTLIAVNETFYELLELPEELFPVGTTLEAVLRYNAERGEYGEGDIEEMVRTRLELAKKFEAHSFERTRTDGVTIKVSGIPLPNGGFVTTYLDITEERSNIDALRDSRNQYQRLMETTNVVPWEYNLKARRFNYVGPQTENLLGYAVEDWYDEEFWMSSMHPDDRESVLEICAEANKRLEDYDIEYRMLTADGGHLWVHNYISISSENDLPVALNGVLVDITQRKKTEQEFARQASLLDLLSAVSVAANNVMDPDTIYYFCLRRICEFTGWSFGHVYKPASDRSGLLESTKFTYVDDKDRLADFAFATELMKFRPGEGLPGRVFKNKSLDWIANIANDTNFRRFETCLYAGLVGGIAVPVEIDSEIVSILEFYSKQEMEPSPDEIEMLNFVAQQVGRVIERSRSEQELTAHRDYLQEMVEMATTELEQKAHDLVEALDKEKQLNELQRQFVSMTSHEFRTPLTIIDSAAQRMKRRVENGGLSPEDAVERIDNIRAAVQRMIRLMESTLSAARMDEGKIGISVGPCNIKKVIRQVCESQNEVTKSHRIALDIVEIPATIKADTGSLEQVFTNLISNAVKYAPDNPDIEVAAYVQDGQIVVSIRDYGLGIDAEDIDRLGERFFRAKTSTGIAGTGIGLNLVKALVQQHGGSLGVESQKGEGSTFIVRLPINGPEPEKSSSDGPGDEIAAA